MVVKSEDKSGTTNIYQIRLAKSATSPDQEIIEFSQDLPLQKDISMQLSDYGRKLYLLSKASPDAATLRNNMRALNYLEGVEDQIYARRKFGGDRTVNIANRIEFQVKAQEDLQSLLERKRLLKQILGEFEHSMQLVDSKARFRGNLIGYSISSILMAQLAFIAQGTYVTLSWDIMEPISYVMGLFNFTCGFGWYYLFITKPECQTVTDWMKFRITQKMLRRKGISAEMLS